MIRLEYDETRSIACIELDRPSSRNALTRSGWSELGRAVHDAGCSAARVLMITSRVPGTFCAGSDLNELVQLVDDVGGRPQFRSMMREAMNPLRALRIPTLCAIDGNCFGAGVALAMACDIRMAGADARFAITPAKLGISYPHEDVRRLVSEIGRGQAARLLFAASAIDAAEALRIGLVQQVAVSARAEAGKVCSAIAGNAPTSIAALKAILDGDGSQDAAFAQTFDSCFDGPNFQEGISAFRERRSPRFDGPR